MKKIKILFFCFITISLAAQSDIPVKQHRDIFELNGYIKNMQIAAFEDNFNDITNDNIIHNRLNFRIYPDSNITIGVELRNRILFGESLESIPDYGQLLSDDFGLIDLSWLIVDEPALIFHTQIDRAWIDWSNESLEVRIGRQRINWGTNLFWNSNDLFNAYSLVDFDYEERPGTDAIRVQKHFKNLSSFDIAVKPGKDNDEWVGALRYQFNKWQYDFQFLVGWWNKDYVLGTGWAGNLGLAGLKGEISYFHPEDNFQDTLGTFSSSISVDYMFQSQLFITGGFLFNSKGIDTQLTVAENLFLQPLSAKNLMPSKYNFLLNFAYPFNPLLNTSIVLIYSPGVSNFFFMPSFGYSIADNWELALFGQSFWLQQDDFENIGNGIFIRIKGSF